MRILLTFVAFLIAAPSLFGTDCQTDCEGHFNKWYQGPDLTRCQGEREVACRTKITTCDVWKFNPQTVAGYYAAIEAISQANKNTGWPMTSNDCHSAVDLGSTAASGVGAAKFLYQVWNYGFKASEILSKSTVVGLIISEGVKSFAHCACTHAKYTKVEVEAAEESNDRFFVSLFNDRWTLWRGKNTLENRAALLQKAIGEVGGSYKKRIRGSFSSTKRTLTEVICREGTYWATATGDESQHTAFEEMKKRGWSECLFRTRNFPSGNPDVSDRFFCSLSRKDGGWWIKTGSIEEKDEVIRIAKEKMDNRWDTMKTGRFSTHRATSTFVSCSKKPEVSGGLEITDSTIFLSSGIGYRSIEKALERVHKSYQGYACFFDTSDVDFGPIP